MEKTRIGYKYLFWFLSLLAVLLLFSQVYNSYYLASYIKFFLPVAFRPLESPFIFKLIKLNKGMKYKYTA